MTNPSPIQRIAKFFPTIEKVALVAGAIGLSLKTTYIAIGDPITNLALSTLAVIYFMTAQLPLEIPSDGKSEQPKADFTGLLGQVIAPKILGIGSSVVVVGIQFAIFHWTGFRQMLIIGSTSLAVASVIVLVASSSSEEMRRAIQPRLIRAVLLMLIGFYLLWVYGIKDPTLYSR